MANVVVSGVIREMGGHKESQRKFEKHQSEVADALLNISGIGTGGQVLTENDPRPPYHYNEYPKAVYHPEKGMETVANLDEEKERLRRGWRLEPYFKPQVVILDPATEKKHLQDKIAQQDGVITQQNDLLQRLLAQVENLSVRLADREEEEMAASKGRKTKTQETAVA